MTDFKKNIVSSDLLVRDVYKLMDSVEKKILIVQEDGVIIGTITDGDIRRSLIKDASGGVKLHEVANRNFIQFSPEEVGKARALVGSGRHRYIPIIDKSGKLHDIESSHTPVANNKDYAGLIMAGGRGLRLMPFTADTPKPMLLVSGKPILEHILEKYINAGVLKIYISVNYLSEKIVDYFGDGRAWGLDLHYIFDGEPRGTMGPLNSINIKSREHLIVINGDVLTDLNLDTLIAFHRREQEDAVICGVKYIHSVPFGVLALDGDYLKEIQEKPVMKYLVNGGAYVFGRELLNKIDIPEKIDAPELIQELINSGVKIRVFPLHESWVDIGNPEELARVRNK